MSARGRGMRPYHLIWVVVVCLLFYIDLTTSSSGGGQYYNPPPPPPPGDYNRQPPPSGQQRPPQGFYPGQGPPQPGQGPPPPPPPPMGFPGRGGPPQYGQGPPPPYGAPRYDQQQQQQQDNQEGSFWSKLTNKIFAGREEDQQQQGGQPYGYPGLGRDGPAQPGGYGYPPQRQEESRGGYPPALPSSQMPGGPPRPGGYPQYGGQPSQSPYGAPGAGAFGQQGQPGQQGQQQGAGGFLAKISAKILSGAQTILTDRPQEQDGPQPPRPPGYPGFGGSPYGPPGSSYGPPQGAPDFGGKVMGRPPQPPQPPQPGPYGRPPPPGPPGAPQMGPGPRGAPPPPYPPPEGQEMYPPQGGEEAMGPPPGMESDEMVPPDVFVMGDNIVMVANPRKLHQKIMRFAQGGPQALQVVANFDGGLKRYRTADGKRRAENTESLIHNAVLMPATRSKIRSVADAYNKEMSGLTSLEDRYANREKAKREIQRIVEVEGQIYFSSIPNAVQDFLGNIPLRPNLEQFVKPLAFRGIPLTIFSTGYAEVLVQILRLSNPGIFTPDGYLPPNMKIVSNFFRTGPDGLVNGFTTPIIHELNCNMTTAREFRSAMDRVPRVVKNALVLGSKLNDLTLTEGLGLEEQLSVGFIEVDREFVSNLPAFLQSFDVVILGDGGMQYVNQLLEQIIGGA